MKVLIVEDSSTMRRIIKNLLIQLNINSNNIFQANDGIEGLEYTKKQKFDLILTDWNMPRMNGYDLVKKIRETDKETPIIMITTEGNKSQVIIALKVGVNNYIVKPFNSTTLLEKISFYLEK